MNEEFGQLWRERLGPNLSDFLAYTGKNMNLYPGQDSNPGASNYYAMDSDVRCSLKKKF